MIEKKPHLSQSQLQMYEKCGEAYRRRYPEHEIIPPGIAIHKGAGVHGGSKANFSQKIESKEDLPRKDIIDISVAQYDHKLRKQGLLMTADEEKVGYEKVVGEARDVVVKLSGLYSDVIAPSYQPAFVETEQRIELPRASHDLLAYMDMADINDIIADLKTGKRKRSQSDVDRDEQLSFYSLVFFAITQRLPAAVRIEQLLEKEFPEHYMVESQRTQNDLGVIIARINAMIHGLKKGVFIPCQASAWWCNEKWCGYARTCPYYQKK